MIIHFLRTPESEGRPERFVFDPLAAEMRAAGYIVEDHYVPEVEPANGAEFYHIEPTVNMIEGAARLALRLSDGDRVLVCDAQAPVVPVIRYLCSLRGLKDIVVGGWFHSSAHQPGDMLYKDPAAIATEQATISQLDVAFAATRSLAHSLYDSCLYDGCLGRKDMCKVVTTYGLPIDHVLTLDMPACHRENVVVWPHRYADDKDRNLLLAYAKAHPEVSVHVLTPVQFAEPLPAPLKAVHCPTKADYYAALSSAKVVLSTAELETFGYAMMEAVALGCYPVVPDLACYSEMYDPRLKYDKTDDTDEVVADIHSLVTSAFAAAQPFDWLTSPRLTKYAQTGKSLLPLIIERLRVR